MMHPLKLPAGHTQMPFCQSNSPALRQSPRFSKHILQIFIQLKKLRIPLRFVRTYGDDICDVAQLIVPDGRVWKLRVKREGKHIWFEDGFYEFVKYYSIGDGHLLNFKYKGMSNFSVHIVDKSSCEIQYPPHQPTFHSVEFPCNDQNSSPVDCFVSPPCPSTKKRKFDSQLKNLKSVSSAKKSYFEPEKEGKRCKVEEVVDISDSIKDSGKDNENSQSGQASEVFVAAKFNEIVSKLSSECKRTLSEARMYKPKSDAFMVVIRKGSFRDQRKMDVPAAFAKKYRNRITGEIIRVQISDEEHWQSEYSIRPKWRIGGGLLLKEGWSSFVISNNLETGGVCIFEDVDKFFQYDNILNGHFLIFEYKGMSVFSLRILGYSSCEIEYPFHETNEEDEYSIEVLHSTPQPSSSNLPRILRNGQSADKGNFQKEKGQEELEGEIIVSRKIKAALSQAPPESNKAVNEAMYSNPKNTSFLVVISPTFLRNNLMVQPFLCVNIYTCID